MYAWPQCRTSLALAHLIGNKEKRSGLSWRSGSAFGKCSLHHADGAAACGASTRCSGVKGASASLRASGERLPLPLRLQLVLGAPSSQDSLPASTIAPCPRWGVSSKGPEESLSQEVEGGVRKRTASSMRGRRLRLLRLLWLALTQTRAFLAGCFPASQARACASPLLLTLYLRGLFTGGVASATPDHWAVCCVCFQMLFKGPAVPSASCLQGDMPPTPTLPRQRERATSWGRDVVAPALPQTPLRTSEVGSWPPLCHPASGNHRKHCLLCNMLYSATAVEAEE